MKEVTVSGLTFQYKVKYESSEFGDYAKTLFCDGTKMVKRCRFNWKKFSFEYYMKEVPNVVFVIYEDANSKYITKEWWRKEIEKQISLLNRSYELENNQLI